MSVTGIGSVGITVRVTVIWIRASFHTKNELSNEVPWELILMDSAILLSL